MHNWNTNNRGVKSFHTSMRRRALRQATPPWVDSEAIKAVYVMCEQLSKITGIKHHVDHIIPIMGKNVKGLHVHWNLQIIPASENLSKGNSHESD